MLRPTNRRRKSARFSEKTPDGACDTGDMTLTEPTLSAPEPAANAGRVASKRTVLMCRPDFFTVVYRINPWMDPALPTDTSLAVRQWETLYNTYLDLGFDVKLVDPIDGLPDMVYAANGDSCSTASPTGRASPTPSASPRAPPT